MSIKLNLLLIALTMGLLACSGEDQAPKKYIDVKLKGQTGECLSHLGEDVSNYFDGGLSEDQVIEIWSCLNGAVQDFEDITAPEHPRGYPPGALARFFSKFFLDREISPSLAQALMNLKRVLIGGEREFLTNEELIHLKQFLSRAQKWSLVLNPHIQTLFLKNPSDLSEQRFQLGFSKLHEVAEEFGDWLEQQDQIYQQQDLRELLSSIREWLNPGPNSELVSELEEAIPLFFKVKAQLIGGTEFQLSPKEWLPFMAKTSVLASTVQRLRWKLNRDRIFTLANERTLENQLQDLQFLFQNVRIPFPEIEDLIKQASQHSWWPATFKAEDLTQTLRFVLDKVFKIQDGPEGLVLDERLVMQLERLKNEFARAWSGQDEKFKEVLRRQGPMDLTADGLLNFSDGQAPSEKARFQFATIYAVIQILSDGYELEVVNAEQFDAIFAEILAELQRYGLLEGTENSLSKRMFREINLFTYPSDGNAVLDVAELSQYGWMVLSGLIQSQRITDAFSQECNKEQACIFSRWTTHHQDWISNFPHLKNELQIKSSDEIQKFFESTSHVAASKNLTLNLIIFGYLELFMMRFDATLDQRIDVTESTTSFEVFGPTFIDLATSAGLKEEDSWALFTYLFNYGETPLNQYGGLIRYVHWATHPETWAYKADRARLLQILSELKKL